MFQLSMLCSTLAPPESKSLYVSYAPVMPMLCPMQKSAPVLQCPTLQRVDEGVRGSSLLGFDRWSARESARARGQLQAAAEGTEPMATELQLAAIPMVIPVSCCAMSTTLAGVVMMTARGRRGGVVPNGALPSARRRARASDVGNVALPLSWPPCVGGVTTPHAARAVPGPHPSPSAPLAPQASFHSLPSTSTRWSREASHLSSIVCVFVQPPSREVFQTVE